LASADGRGTGVGVVAVPQNPKTRFNFGDGKSIHSIVDELEVDLVVALGVPPRVKVRAPAPLKATAAGLLKSKPHCY